MGADQEDPVGAGAVVEAGEHPDDVTSLTDLAVLLPELWGVNVMLQLG